MLRNSLELRRLSLVFERLNQGGAVHKTLFAWSLVFCLSADVPWHSKRPDQWTSTDVDQILNSSPWAQSGTAEFPDVRQDDPTNAYPLPGAAQAGMPGFKGATDGRWDGGVGKNTGHGQLPTLPVTVRWDSSLPIREALLRQNSLEGRHSELAISASQPSKSYVLTVLGLLPSNQYRKAGQLANRSSSEGELKTGNDSEQVLEGFMANSKLRIQGAEVLGAEDVKLDSETGAVHIFFPRTHTITPSDKEVVFTTRFGSLRVVKKFRLGDMKYHGRLEL